jgi:hypothetical protein
VNRLSLSTQLVLSAQLSNLEDNFINRGREGLSVYDT